MTDLATIMLEVLSYIAVGPALLVMALLIWGWRPSLSFSSSSSSRKGAPA
jgi:hypothetical protein